jgi:hypothetical protein
LAKTNQMEMGRRRLGYSKEAELSSRQKILAFEAGCPAGGMKPRLMALEGRKGYRARQLLQEGNSVKKVYLHVLYGEKL